MKKNIIYAIICVIIIAAAAGAVAFITNPFSDQTPTPTVSPTENPTASPTEKPTSAPTTAPTAKPTSNPTSAPTTAPTAKPTSNPTTAPTPTPTPVPDKTVTFLIEDGNNTYFWVKGEGDTVLDAWTNAATNYNIRWVQATDDNATWGEVESMFGIGSVNKVIAGQDWPYWSWWMTYKWSNSTNEWVSASMANTTSTSSHIFAIYYGNNSVYTPVPNITPEHAVAWDRTNKGQMFLIQSPSGMYFWVTGNGTTIEDAWVDAATTYSIPYTMETSGSYAGNLGTTFGVQKAGQYYWKVYVNNGTNLSAWNSSYASKSYVLSGHLVSEHPYVAFIYGNWQSSPKVTPVTIPLKN
jgi:hypothetical protein